MRKTSGLHMHVHTCGHTCKYVATCIPYTKRKNGVEFGKDVSVGKEEPRTKSLIPEIRGARAQVPTVSSWRTGCIWRGQPTQSVKDTAQRLLCMRLPRRGRVLAKYPRGSICLPGVTYSGVLIYRVTA